MLKQLTWGLQRLCLASPLCCSHVQTGAALAEEGGGGCHCEESFQLLISQRELCRLLGLC